MEDKDKKNDMVKIMTDIEYYSFIPENEPSLAKYTKLPLANVSALGVAFEPLTTAFKNILLGTEGGKSGLYRVTVAKGGHLAEFQNGTGYLGSVLKGNNQVGGGQAILNPLVCNPAMLFMAAALMSIDKKLDSIQETQLEILEFLEQKEKLRLKGNLSVLQDILNNYKYNWDNEKYKTNKHIQVQEIKRDAEQGVIFYREQIDKKIKKKSFLHSDQDVKGVLEKVHSEFKDYQISLYLYSFSSFLEVMLLENFASAYLDSVADKIEDYSYQYRKLYTKSYNQIDGYAKSSVQSHLLSGLASISKVAGDTVAKVPVVSKYQLDENLIEASGLLGKINSKKAEKTMDRFVNNQGFCVQPFVENINAVNRLYNQPMELLFDKENLYIGNNQF